MKKGNAINSIGIFRENVEYDCNGNITRLRRYGLTDNLHGGFGLVDDLYMTYEGNMLTSVCDSASRYSYAGATDFDGVPGQVYPLTYNGSGSLVSDAGRGIARIDYDLLNNPVRIQFTNGNVTKYIYSAAGEKLRVIHQTAVPNITVPIGSVRELAPSEILSADSTDYLLGGSLTLRNGRVDKLQFEEGYCQAAAYSGNASQDNFTFHYYDRDHLGNIRQVIKATGSNKGTVVQTMDYYPFGAEFCHSSTASEVQSRKYNGKELDRMHGLDTYDYGARQYNPVTARWDRVDPLCEKYYAISPYVYCHNNPVMLVDPDGRIVKTLDEQSQNNIINTLTEEEEAAYVCFKDGILDTKRLLESNSQSENIMALKALSESDKTYEFSVASEYTNNGKTIEFKSNRAEGTVGATTMPGEKESPSPDSNIHIYVGDKLNPLDQVTNTAHEAYGHAYFYELKSRGMELDPIHRYVSKTKIGSYDKEYNNYEIISERVDNNILLDQQIKKVTLQAEQNYKNRMK